jgi:hypothetical protein
VDQGLALCFSGCVAVPILAVEATCQVASIAFRANDPDSGGPVTTPSIPSTARTRCAEAGAGPDTDCIDYMTHMSNSYY